MNNKNDSPLEWKLWANWVFAMGLAFLINDSSQLFISNGSLFAFAYNLLLEGLIIAFLQWILVLRLHAPNASRWIWCSSVGWSAGWLLGKFSGSLIISLLIHGIILGITQWLLFLRNLYSKSWLWVFVSGIGLPFAYGLSWFVIFPLVLGDYNGPFSGPLDSVLRGILFGGLTGAIIIWLSRSPHTEADTMTSTLQ
jgi:hypothetical protein